MPYFSGFYGKSGKIKIKIEKNVKKLLTDAGIDARISLASAVRTQRNAVNNIWRDIEVVITRRS